MSRVDARPGTLIVIGGHEDKDGDKHILQAIVDALPPGRLVVATIASYEPEGYFDTYKQAFSGLGLTDLVEVYVEERREASEPDKLSAFDGATGVFFSGGDQLRISSQMGDTPLEARVRKIFAAGGVVAGTSAGASALGETMLVRGASAESHRIGDLHLAPGLGLIPDVIIDQHFAERGRIGRLLGAVALNPRILGIGIDEDTAIVVKGRSFDVIGAGAVYVLEATDATHSNIAEAQPESALSIFDVRLHVLSAGDGFDLGARTPIGRRPLKGAA
ncbi:cyanophycinase [Terricaulis sp.]|uniref:cyanophycinase n=1 Tax=Terricaulis sp. TaxID=2768686 RepID=UPI002AC720AD|nr:cyanophycinase [Terricaulis sp.]MDZ4690292.1 cyanophycinase [Terricaulis sp.]